MGKEPGSRSEGDKQHCHNKGFLKEYSTPTYVTRVCELEYTVKPVKKSTQQPVAFLPWTKQERSQCRGQGKRIERGEENRNRDRHSKLLVKASCDTGNERRGHEYGGQNQRNSDDWTREFLHRLQRPGFGRESFLDVALDALNDNDRVVDHQTDRQDQPEQRKRIDRKTE